MHVLRVVDAQAKIFTTGAITAFVQGAARTNKNRKLIVVTLILRAKAISDHFKGPKDPVVNKLYKNILLIFICES